MPKLKPGQRDLLFLCIVGFFVYQWLVRYEMIQFIITLISEGNMYSAVAFFLVLGSACTLYSFRRWRMQVQVNQKWQRMTLIDELTGLYNRRGFLTLCTQRLRRSSSDTYLLYADLDNMKWINDQLGHHVGDHALIKTAHLLRNSFTKSAVIARLGGDEFALFVQGVPRKLMERMIREFAYQVEQYNAGNQRNYFLSISVGLAHCTPKFSCSLTELMAEADRAMYAQKIKKKELVQDSNVQL